MLRWGSKILTADAWHVPRVRQSTRPVAVLASPLAMCIAAAVCETFRRGLPPHLEEFRSQRARCVCQSTLRIGPTTKKPVFPVGSAGGHRGRERGAFVPQPCTVAAVHGASAMGETADQVHQAVDEVWLFSERRMGWHRRALAHGG